MIALRCSGGCDVAPADTDALSCAVCGDLLAFELRADAFDARAVDATLGTILKYREDQERVRAHGLAELVHAAVQRGA